MHLVLTLIVGLIAVLNLVLTFGVIRRLREHTEQLSQLSLGRGAPTLQAGTRVGRFEATTTEGQPVSSQAWENPTVVGFFTSGCQPCENLLPKFVEYAASMPQNREQVLAVLAGDAEENRAKVEALLPYARVVLEPHDGDVVRAFGVRGYPTVCLVQKDGTLAVAAADLQAFPEPAPL